MSHRPDKDSVFLSVAHEIAQLGTCDRARVGAVLTRDGRAISWGFNGSPPGLPHCEDNHHGWDGHILSRVEYEMMKDDPTPLFDQLVKEHGCINTTHAEANALAFAARQGISTDGATLYVTMSPCAVCARLTIAAGIFRVVTDTLYRDDTGTKLLEQALVPVELF